VERGDDQDGVALSRAGRAPAIGEAILSHARPGDAEDGPTRQADTRFRRPPPSADGDKIRVVPPVSFANAAAFRKWLARHHAAESAIELRIIKKHAGTPGLTYREAIEEALCYGWIDGVVHAIDAVSFRIRFTPRKPSSYWSAVNLRRYAELDAAGRIAPPGRAAFERRVERPRARYSFENPPARFSAPFVREFKTHPEAWRFFAAQPPGYKRTATFWVMSAVREETRTRRLTRLIDVSAEGRRLDVLAPSSPARPRLARGASND